MSDFEQGKDTVNISGKNFHSNQFSVGDNNQLTMSVAAPQFTDLPDPNDVNIQAELGKLREILAALETPDRRKIDNAFDEAEEESSKPEPDKDEVGIAVDRVIKYAQKTQSFVEIVDKLKPHIKNIAAWLGENWYKFLAIF